MNIKIGRFIASAWIVSIALLYFIFFPPAKLLSALPVIHSFKPSLAFLEHLACLVLFVVAANGFAIKLWSYDFLNIHEKFTFATAGGLGAISLIILFFSLIGIINNALYFLILITGLLLFFSSLKNIHGKAHHHTKALYILSVIPLVSTLLGALASPTQFDSLVYHLALPAQYIRAGKIFAVPHNMFFAFPQAMEMLYQMALIIDGEILANLIHWLFLPLGALALYDFCKRFWDTTTGLIASIIWLLTPSVMFVSTGTYVDLALALYVFLSLYCLLLWKTSRRTLFINLCAIFSGIACGIKYTAAINLLIITVLILSSKLPRLSALDHEAIASGHVPANGTLSGHDQKRPLKHCMIYLFIVFLLFMPWLFKNAVFLSNPVAPFCSELFSASKEAQLQSSSYIRHIASHGTSALFDIKAILLLPWDISFHGYKFGGAFDIPGAVFLIFIPILFLRMKIDKIEKTLSFYCLFFIIIWIFTGRVLRFLMPLAPLLCILSARGVISLIQQGSGRVFKYSILAALGVLLFHNLIFYHWAMASVNPYSQVIGGIGKGRYLSGKLNYYQAAAQLNSLPPATRTLFLGETRSFYCPGDIIVPTDFDANPLIEGANSSGSASELLTLLHAQKITHILVNNYEFERLSVQNRFTDKGLAHWYLLKKQDTVNIYKDKYCEIYELTY